DTDLPPDQLYSRAFPRYFNQGRRRITTEQTYHEDVLKQPVLEILSAKLILHNNEYVIIGELQNIDNVPSDVVLKGTLYNNDDQELASYNAKYVMKHKLMPKEITSFRIDFERTAWSKIHESAPKTFNPDEFTPIDLDEQPVKFDLHAAGNVTNSDLFKNIAISELNLNDHQLNGQLFNSGLEEITVPQLIISYYNKQKELSWVEHQFLKEAIPQQKKLDFQYNYKTTLTSKVISKDMSNCFVNGLPNQSISDKIVPNRIIEHRFFGLQNINNKEYPYLKLEFNSFIGNL
ncbi:MAG: hypothetical protein JKY02_06615, partial [Flavobacteriaceae bacterium]|nr:hypothetical protein [Flavobacteriaceae bacterium]